MPTVKKLDSGSYEVRFDYYDDQTGQRRQGKRRFDRKGDANQFVKDLARDEAAIKKAPPFNAWIDAWFATYKITAGLEATTITSYSAIIDRLKLHFGVKPVDKISPSEIERLYVRMQHPEQDKSDCPATKPLTNKPLSSSTCQRHHAVLRRALSFAVRDGLIRANPADRVTRPKSSAEEIDPPTVGEIDKLVLSLRNTPQYLAVCIAIATGMRMSEIFGLKWDAVDISSNQVHVSCVRQKIPANREPDIVYDNHTRKLIIPGLSGCWIERDRTKNKHQRTMKIPKELSDMLKAEQKRQKADRLRLGAEYIQTPYVCVHEDGLPLAPWDLSTIMENHRFHDLRHANATLLLNAGRPIAEVSRRLGHTNVYTTLKTYTHTVKSADEEAAAALSEVFSGSLGKRKKVTHR